MVAIDDSYENFSYEVNCPDLDSDTEKLVCNFRLKPGTALALNLRNWWDGKYTVSGQKWHYTAPQPEIHHKEFKATDPAE